MTWLSFCAKRPGPSWKQSYGTGDRRLDEIEGVVDHSMEGSLAGAYSVLDGPRQASWTFSIPKVGEPIQHYELSKITWHAGLPGDRRTDTSLIGNLTLVGKEHEGRAGEPWTANQVHWSAKIDVALRAMCPAFGANPPTLRKNMWEHRWLSATSCPSGRNPWQAKFALINEWEDDMPTLKEITDALRPVIAAESKKAVVAALAGTAKSVTEVRNSLRGGDLPGIWVKAKGQKTIYYVEYVGGVLLRHHARNPASYIGVGGDWRVIEVSPEQLELMPRGPGLPDLKVS
ncbi:hypothetical protein LCGC14_0979680 [marine sediment metagenome]|uniref:N-acetylmuramoyl-L-alanine amidase n=1 Tax=marine sediment metagenome TaxID=412755 RepID=A0A0F9NDM7_9ZZZZ